MAASVSAKTSNEEHVVLCRPIDLGLGMEFTAVPGKKGIGVARLTSEGLAAKSGNIKAGDVITSINNIDVTSMSFDDSLKILKHCTGTKLDLVIQRSTEECHRDQELAKGPLASLLAKVKGLIIPEKISIETQTLPEACEELRPSDIMESRCKENEESIPSEMTEKPIWPKVKQFKTFQATAPEIPRIKKVDQLRVPSRGSKKVQKEHKPSPPSSPSDSSYISDSELNKDIDLDDPGMDIADSPLNSTPDIKDTGHPECPAPQKLRYLQDESLSVEDTLHHKATVPYGCTAKKCMGSIMTLPPTKPYSKPRAKADLIRHAKDFIHQFYASIKKQDSPGHHRRWTEVLDSIHKKGTYDLSFAELTFGCKTAWRNAPRCIGRIQWSKLQVFDARDIRTTRGMFEAICNHIKYATNKGIIRSAITIFPQRTEKGKDFRIWNTQLIRYAGYKNENGSITGDPASVELTRLCIELGWKAPGTAFDILPLILQAEGQDPEMFEIPPDIVLQVYITHPNYLWFEDMSLQWYALPAVSNMYLDCGGLEFTATPFNGWYMGSEIATRNFCDTARYNILETVAQKMGLDTSTNTKLWKDKALVEINIAVLHSYQKNHVTIIDHHSASESFMKHLENESASRGGCPSDWVWLVPPISGSLSPVFHQELINYKLYPCYDYQDNEPWRTYVWKHKKIGATAVKVETSTGEDNSKKERRKIKFKDLARAVKISANLMKKALAKRIQCTILYASETGRAQNFSKQISDLFKHTFDARVVCMCDYDASELQHEALVLVVTSTYGNGEPPDNGTEFYKALQNMMQTSNTTSVLQSSALPSGEQVAPVFANVRFSVFGLGSRAYPKFCNFAKEVDFMLGELGGERINPLGMGDEMSGQTETFKEWSQQVYKAAQSWASKQEEEDKVSMETVSKVGKSWSTKHEEEEKMKEKDSLSTVSKITVPQRVQSQPVDIVTGVSIPALSTPYIAPTTAGPKYHSTPQVPMESTPQVPKLFVDPPSGSSNTPSYGGTLGVIPEIQVEDSCVEDGAMRRRSQDSSLLDVSSRSSGMFDMSCTDISSVDLDWYEMLHREYLLMREAACDAFCLDETMDPDTAAAALSTSEQMWCVDRYRLVPACNNTSLDLCKTLSSIHGKNVVACRLIERTQLQAPESGRQTILCRLDTMQNEAVSYRPGDHLAIFPSNSPELVNAILEYVDIDSNMSPDDLVRPEVLDDGGSGIVSQRKWVEDNRLPVTSLHMSLSSLLDITTPPSQHMLRQMAALCSLPAHTERLESLAQDRVQYEDWKFSRYPHLVEVLQEFPSIRLPASFLLTQLPLLQQRFYSISSCPDLYPGEVHATIAVVRYCTQDGQGPLHHGVCSNWMNEIKLGTQIPCFIRRAPHYYLPPDQSIPIILVGPGTGVAPLRAFWQQRMVDLDTERKSLKDREQSRLGTMSLYFGCRTSSLDHIYKEEMKEIESLRVINHVKVALSREPGIPKTYVQDLLLKDSSTIYKQLVQEGGHIYVCGDVSMASGVCKTLEEILMKEAGLNAQDAKGYIMMMREKNRFHEDIFGVTLKMAEIQRSAREQAKLGWKQFAETSKFLTPVQQRRYSLPALLMCARKKSGTQEVVQAAGRAPTPMPLTLRRYSKLQPADKGRLAQLYEISELSNI